MIRDARIYVFIYNEIMQYILYIYEKIELDDKEYFGKIIKPKTIVDTCQYVNMNGVFLK